MTALVRDSQARAASRQKMIANPTLVAIEDWQLQDLKKAEAAVEVQKKAKPAKQEVAMEDSPPARKGIDSAAPILKK